MQYLYKITFIINKVSVNMYYIIYIYITLSSSHELSHSVYNKDLCNPVIGEQ